MSLRIAAVLTALVLSIPGCAADADEPRPETPVAEVDTDGLEPRYVARVTKADIVAGGSSCGGNLCSINGTLWDCTGGGYCSRIST